MKCGRVMRKQHAQGIATHVTSISTIGMIFGMLISVARLVVMKPKRQLYKTPKGISIDGSLSESSPMAGRFTIGLGHGTRDRTSRKRSLAGTSGVEHQRQHTLADLDGEIYLKAESGLKAPPTADVNA